MTGLEHKRPETLSPDRWRRLLAALDEIGALVDADPHAQTPLLKAETPRFILRVLDMMQVMGIELADGLYPRLVRLMSPYRHFGGNLNPDCIYFYARIEPGHTYRIHGRRGTSRIVEVQTMDGHLLSGPDHKGLVTLTDIEADADGNIDVLLSADPQPGNWLKLEPGACWLYMRQYLYDWENEQSGDFVIERLGATYPPLAITPEQLDDRTEQLIAWIPTWYRHLLRMAASYYDSPANAFNFVYSKSGMAQLYYGKGHFAFGEGEGVLVEFKPPAGPYWSFQIMNRFWEGLEWDTHQCSLNGHQGWIGEDGVFRAVISDRDPGIANWFDSCGHRDGLICGRVLRPETLPDAKLSVVKLTDLAHILPADTPQLTPEQRSATLRRRSLAADATLSRVGAVGVRLRRAPARSPG